LLLFNVCSINGTFVNGKKIGKGNKVLLHNGDEIALAAQKGKPECIDFQEF
jgi:pSer/pThr/pTyr-binding forkhead associated (FHA) protein